MNWLILLSAVLVLILLYLHLTVGKKYYLKPLLQSEADQVAKKFASNNFHFYTAFILFSFVILSYMSMIKGYHREQKLLINFIATCFAYFGLMQFLSVSFSGIKNGLLKLFYWIIMILIAGFAWSGLYVIY